MFQSNKSNKPEKSAKIVKLFGNKPMYPKNLDERIFQLLKATVSEGDFSPQPDPNDKWPVQEIITAVEAEDGPGLTRALNQVGMYERMAGTLRGAMNKELVKAVECITRASS